MAFQHEQANAHFVHRDLASRNVLVDVNLVCKVADFGLSRAISTNNDALGDSEYYRSTTGLVPLRWTAPEALESMRFDNATDIWSFGITLVRALPSLAASLS
jgi:serine/threonine protein kinase